MKNKGQTTDHIQYHDRHAIKEQEKKRKISKNKDNTSKRHRRDPLELWLCQLNYLE